MSSSIPTFSSRKPGATQSRLLAPSTLRKPGLIRPTNATTIKKVTQLSGLKRPSDSVFASQNKFKRTTPLSLMRNKTLTGTKPVTSNYVAARLDFTGGNFKTPVADRHRNEPLNEDNNNAFEIVSAPKVQMETKATSPIVDWKTKDTEINSYKCKISILEKQMDEMTFKNSRIRIENEVKETKMKSELDGLNKILKELKKELAGAKENEQRLEGNFDKLNQEYLEATNSFEKQQLDYEKTITELKDEMSTLTSNESSNRSALISENMLLKHRVSELENERQKQDSEMGVHVKNYDELKLKECEINRLRKDLNCANSTIERLNDQMDMHKESANMKEILKNEIAHYKQLQEENCHLKNQLDLLKDVRDENLILKEKLHNSENQIEELNQLIGQKNLDLGELNFSKKRIHEWIQILGVDAPDIVVGQLNELKQTISVLRLENDTLKAEVRNQNDNDSFRDFSVSKNELKLKKAKEEIEHLTITLKKLNRKCNLVSKHRDSYKKMIDSYESEVTINFDDVNRRRVYELETIVNEYKLMLDNQEKDLKRAQEFVASIGAKESELEELKCEIERIKKLNPQIRTNMSLDISTLQTRENNFRVIHLKKNPLTLRINEYATEYNKLKEENSRLKSLVEVLESGDVADMTRQLNEGMQHRSDVEKLQKKFESLDKRYNQLRDTYKKISKSFRETCYFLTGYKIDNIANHRYKLTHAYDPLKRPLYFEMNDNQIVLLQESSMQSLQDKIDTYLTEGESYPAFLAAFTLELFDKSSTLSRSSMWSS